MKWILLSIVFLFLGCKKFTRDHKQETDVITAEPPIVIIEETELPEGAIIADFLGNQDSLYAFIKKNDTLIETTLIGFQNNKLPDISIPESIGADLYILKLQSFETDVLLVNAKLKDTNFNEYYLFMWKDSTWKQPVNRFNIHKSNMSDTLIPIQINPKDSTEFLRYYSVFDMDRNSSKKFSWLLQHETVKIERVP